MKGAQPGAALPQQAAMEFSQGKELGVLVAKFPMSQQHALVDKKASGLLGCIQESVASSLGEILFLLCSYLV